MVNVAKPWLICGCQSLTIVCFFIISSSKTMVNFEVLAVVVFYNYQTMVIVQEHSFHTGKYARL